jgi:hypothetical protein
VIGVADGVLSRYYAMPNDYLVSQIRRKGVLQYSPSLGDADLSESASCPYGDCDRSVWWSYMWRNGLETGSSRLVPGVSVVDAQHWDYYFVWSPVLQTLWNDGRSFRLMFFQRRI